MFLLAARSSLASWRATIGVAPRAIGSFGGGAASSLSSKSSYSSPLHRHHRYDDLRNSRLVGFGAAAAAPAALSISIAGDSRFSSPTSLEAAAPKTKKKSKHQERPEQKYAAPPPISPPLSTDAANDPPPRPDLPTIPFEEVEEHCDEDSMWFTFRGAVYDLTFFLDGHPGATPVSALWQRV